ncbi:LysR family transcriptional regulator [Aliikangiella coralliicola]|uniref:LysR family transcriptional regulator n=1 Tax=Aliikangiella coralliicola TaxID=2592383 RepID=A0A545U7H3_9GAMM|nr:LysR family transcriptional regulator [Aliikangiella coralliicola]TQV85411.1 LysR family transcriptional regulator [Aliikangiella coralliicola]
MKLQQLRFILAIADCGLNITQASQKLYTSQPGVSKQLRLLEEELGIEIFSRNGKSLVGITAQGKIVLEKAQEVMETVNEIKEFSNQLSARAHPLPIQRFAPGA